MAKNPPVSKKAPVAQPKYKVINPDHIKLPPPHGYQDTKHSKHDTLQAFNIAKEKIRKKQKKQFRKNLGAEQGVARQEIEQYFHDQGITDLAPYQDAIDKAMREASQDVPRGVGAGVKRSAMHTYFDAVPEDLYNSESDRKRIQARAALEHQIPTGFEEDRISNTTDDAIIQQILDEQRAKATDYAQNLMDRHVINQTGYDAAIADIMGQQPRIQGMLEDVGGNLLSGARSNLKSISDQGYNRASQLNLNMAPFDANKYAQDIESAFNDFMGGLDTKFRAQVGQGDLFTTSQLASKAGAAQGPQNFRFDPRALGGLDPLTDEEQEDRHANPIF